MKSVLLAVTIILAINAKAQTTHILRVATNSRVAVQFSTDYSFEFNGQLHRMPAMAIWEIPFSGDSVHIRMIDKRLAKNKAEELNISAKDTTNLFMFFAPYKNYGNSHFRVDANCSCFDSAMKNFKPIRSVTTDAQWKIARPK